MSAQYVAEAAAAHSDVVEADLPEEFRVPAFRELLRHRLGLTQPDRGSATEGAAKQGTEGPTREEELRGLDAAARRLGVSPDELADVFHFGPEGVELVVASTRLPAQKSAATRVVAILLAAARQGGGLDPDGWTPVKHVRDALDRYKKYDQANFANHLRSVGEAFNTRGRGAKLELRLTRPGWEQASALVKELTGS